MPQPPVFGRRQSLAPAAPTPKAAPETAPRRAAPDPLLQALSAPATPPADVAFAAWRRERTLGSRMIWLASLALCAPGLVCIALHASWPVSAVLEFGGLVGSRLLRRERRRRLKAISTWSPDPAGP